MCKYETIKFIKYPENKLINLQKVLGLGPGWVKCLSKFAFFKQSPTPHYKTSRYVLSQSWD